MPPPSFFAMAFGLLRGLPLLCAALLVLALAGLLGDHIDDRDDWPLV